MGHKSHDGRFPKFHKEHEYNAIASLSWVKDAHTLKFGFNGNWLLRGTSGSGNFAGRFDFGRDVNNPSDSNYAYSNALLGNFSHTQEISHRVRYQQVPHGALEWYAQDNWKVNNKLTLDYGVRLSSMIPEYETDPSRGFLRCFPV